MSGNTVRFRAGLGNRKRSREPAREQVAAPASRLARQLALAYFIEHEIEAGRVKNYAEVAGRLGISRARGQPGRGHGALASGGAGGDPEGSSRGKRERAAKKALATFADPGVADRFLPFLPPPWTIADMKTGRGIAQTAVRGQPHAGPEGS